MSETVGDFLLRRLQEWGVKRIYGYQGDGIMGALGRAGNDPELVQVCHEGRRRSWRAPTPRSPRSRRLSGYLGAGAIHLLGAEEEVRMKMRLIHDEAIGPPVRLFGRFLYPTPRRGCRRRKGIIRSSQAFCKPYPLLW